MSAESVALIPEYAEFGAVWHPTDRERWRAYLGVDEDLDEPEVVIVCPTCAEREFGGDSQNDPASARNTLTASA